MENHYFQFRHFVLKIFFGVGSFLLCLPGFTQTQVNINKTGSKPDIEINISERSNIPFFAQAKRARVFDLNSNIANPRGLQQGQKIRLQLFKDKDFSSTIVRKSTDVNGVTAITLKIDDFEYSYGYITVSENSFLVTIDIPETQEKFTTRKNPENNSHYLLQLDKDKWDIIDEGEPVNLNETDDGNNYPLPDNNRMGSAPTEGGDLHSLEGSTLSPDDDATVKIMIVYTPAARDWANTYNESIDNTVATAMASANNVSANSGLGINYNLVYSGLVDHIEAGSGNDLSALRNEDDDRMDEIHDIRRDVQADLVAIFTLTDDTGGVAYLLFDKYGKPDLGFSLTRVQQATDSYTFIHELGHNMGIGHYKYQNVQPGNTTWINWPENTWSGGWRWKSTDSNMYSDVMTYQGGQYHEDGITSYRTPYFSDPEHIYIGAKAGDEVEGNGALTLREMKHVIANYSNTIAYCSASAGTLSTLFINEISMGEISNSSSANGHSDYSSIIIPILPQETQSLQIAVSGFGSKKQILVWIDWNDDKIFDPVTELEYESSGNYDQYITKITAPLGVEPGGKRMRIRLHDLDAGGNSTPCGNTEQGEVEEYTIDLKAVPACEIASVPQNLQHSQIESNHYTLAWDRVDGINYYDLRFRKSGTEDWTIVSNIVYPFYTLKDLEESTLYETQVRSICSGTASDYSSSKFTTTDAAATVIAFVDQPQETQEGRAMAAVSVELLDDLGNRKNSTAEVTIGLTDEATTGAILSGTLTVAAIDGLATFKDLKVDETGTYKLEASRGSLKSVSEDFRILIFEQANYVVTNEENEGPGTLREAIELANQSDFKDIISFNIEGEGPHRIELLENLPAITQKIELDATLQSNYSHGFPQIIIDGSKVPRTTGSINFDLVPKAFYLIGNSSGSVIKGFVLGGFGAVEESQNGEIQGYFGAAIISQGTGAHTIQSNFVGISENGIEAFGNYGGMYILGGTDNLIGGPSPEEKNVISGNLQFGLATSSTSNNNYILGNYIGTSSDGEFEVPNNTGLVVYGQSYENHIEGNTISGNTTGIYFTGRSNIVTNNKIGTDATGEFAVPNKYGMTINSDQNIIGAKDQGNLISGNKDYGIYFDYAANNKITANLIGTDKSGNNPIPNEIGIYFYRENSNNIIGGTMEAEGNVISGNSSHGIHFMYSSNNEIFGNYIGTSKDGKSPLGNGQDGIHLVGNDNAVGEKEGKSNSIAFNGGAGVTITEYGRNNLISQNKIFSNSMGIDLGADGITQNDREDRDFGANRLQNFPELKNPADLEGGYLNLEYTVGSTSQNSTFPITVEFFKSDGNRQGKEYLGFDVFRESDITKGKKGKMIRLQLVPGTTLNGGDKILATATDAEGNTSEFGAEVDVTGGCAESLFYADTDGDGLGDQDNTQSSCTQPDGYVTNSDDCDDTDADIQSGPTWYADADGDTFGDPNDTKTACDQPEGYVSNSDDCDDTDDLKNPDTIWYADADGDGFGNPNNTQTGCDQPEGFVINDEDCDDTDAEIVEGSVWYADTDADGLGDPGSTETACDQPAGFVENKDDCDDTNAEVGAGSVWYADSDNDGFGDREDIRTACTQPEGYVSNNEDCDDTDDLINPETIWYADKDGDGYGDPNSTLTGCEQPVGYVTNSDDCDDTETTVNPELVWYADFDRDGFGDPDVTESGCEQPNGYVANYEDCDDSDASVNPNASDVCYDCDPTNDVGCEVECLGTDVLSLSEVCTDESNVHWVINNPGSCSAEVRWESRKTNEAGVISASPGDTFFSTGISGRGPTQVTIYWPDSFGNETKTNSNASGKSCNSSTELSGAMGDETTEDANTLVKVYPNPVTSEGIWLRFAERNKKAQFKIVVYDLSGRKMAETMASVDTTGTDILWDVDHSRWIEGIYILNISSGNEIYQIKVIK